MDRAGILLDTHILLWWLADDGALSAGARAAISNPDNVIYVSAATAWEVAIKTALGRISLDGDLEQAVGEQGFEMLPISFSHAQELRALPPIHRDPFDRMMIAQARIEQLRLLTVDTKILQYPVSSLAG